MENRINELKEKIKYYCSCYESGKPEITDTEYDNLCFELEELLEKNGNISESLTPIMQGSDAGLKKVKHVDFVGSLDKVKTREKFDSFINNVLSAASDIGIDNPEIIIQHKYDGLTIVAEYNDGKLTQALTRGSGEYGEDVTESILRITDGVPSEIPFKNKLRVRFEALISTKSFEEINKTENFSNERNLVAGTIRQIKDYELMRKRGVFGRVFDVLYIEGKAFSTGVEELEFLQLNGFKTADTKTFIAGEKDVFSYYMGDFAEKERKNLPYKIDGIVFKANSIKLRNYMGLRFNNPRWAIALKFKSLDASTVLNSVKWNVSGSGKVTPVAYFDKVIIDNVEITKATLHNCDNITAKNLHIGDTLLVARQNDVIPAVIANLKNNGGEVVKIPDICPSCGSSLIRDGAYLYCKNIDCRERVIHEISEWCHKSRANIENLSEKRIAVLFDAGILKSVEDIYALRTKKEDALKISRFGETLFNKIVDNIDNSEFTLSRFIFALGISGVGFKTSSDISGIVDGKVEEFLELIESDKLEEKLIVIDGIGDVITSNIVSFIKNNTDRIKRLLKIANVKNDESKSNAGKLTGMSFLFTGKLSNPRNYYEEMVTENGGIVLSSVTKKLSYLVVGDNPGSKLDKAKKNNVEIIGEQDFLDML